MNIAVILAGGRGTRLGGALPKQFVEVEGKPLIGYCLDTFMEHPLVDAVRVVAGREWHESVIQCLLHGVKDMKWNGFSKPGRTRQLSVCHALEDILQYASPEDYVMIHDAARPLVSRDFITACFDKAAGHDGVMPVTPMKDTVYYSEDGARVTSLLKRETIFAGQAPEVFRLGSYYEANRALMPDKILTINGSTEPAVMAGLDIVMTAGEEGNYKITTQEDLERFGQEIAKRRGDW